MTRRLRPRLPARLPSRLAGSAWIEVGGASHPGPRPENQDRWVAGDGWGAVCDGVGGHAGGARAAELALGAAEAALRPAPPPAPEREAAAAVADALCAAALAADVAVRREQVADPARASMATTLTVARAAVLRPDRSRWVVVHVGDSPAWAVGRGGARQVTWDHNLAGELLRTGALDAAGARGHPGRRVVTRAVGAGPPVVPEVDEVDLSPGDALVLASDGLSDVLSDDDVAARVAAGAPAAAVAERLVRAALDAGTGDNVTVVVLRHRACCDDAPAR